MSGNFYTTVQNSFNNAINYVEDRKYFYNRSLYSWESNSNIAFLSSLNANAYDYNRASNISAVCSSIKNFKSSIPELQDIFIFFKYNNIVLSSAGSWTNESADKYLASININLQKLNDNVSSNNRSIISYANDANILYVYTISNFQVVYIINKKVVNQMLSKFISPDYAIFTVIDNENNVLESNAGDEKSPHFKSSYDLSKKDNYNYLLKYNTGQYYNQLFITNVIGMALCLLLLLFIVITLVLLKRDLYNPMQNILKKIPLPDNTENFTEFEIIEHSIEQLNGRIFNYQSEWNKVSNALEQIAINRIFYTNTTDCSNDLNLGPYISANYYCILTLVMEDPQGEKNFNCLSSFNNRIEASFKFTQIFSPAKISTYIFFFPENEIFYNKFVPFINNYIKSQNNCFCIAGLSNLFLGEENIKTAYVQSQKALNSIPTNGLAIPDPICWYSDKLENEKIFSIPIEYFNKLVNSILSADIQAVSSVIEDIMNINQYIDVFQKRNLLLYIYETLCLIISKNTTYDKILDDKKQKPFDLVNGTYNIEVFYALILNYYQEVIGALLIEKTDIHKVIIDYINANMDKNISLQQLADEMGFSYSYMGQYFKNKTGMNFVDFLQEKRINNSADLLTSTTLDISEIASRTGFNTINTFFRTFKKFKGVTPGEYRKQYSAKC